MELTKFERLDETSWRYPATGKMRVPVVIYATEKLLSEMEEKVLEQAANVATLPGVFEAVYVMPDAHWGYGFPIGGVAAFDPAEDGVISVGGIGFDISCGIRTLRTGLKRQEVEPLRYPLADKLFKHIPAGLGSRSHIRLSDEEMDGMLLGGARWAVEQGYGWPEDLEVIEERGCMAGARVEAISHRARERMRRELGTLGSGNHYLEVQYVERVFDPHIASVFGLAEGDVVVTIHCGSRGLGHQIATEFLPRMYRAAQEYGIELPDRELACAPIRSPLGEEYLGAMRAAINCALANRQVLTHFTRQVFAELFPDKKLTLIYDVSHNTCKEELHRGRKLFVHRKGATRAFGPGHPDLPERYRDVGQPVIIGGSMGTASYILAGAPTSEERSFSSTCHGAGRCLSRRQAVKTWSGKEIIERLEKQGIIVRSPSFRGVAEEAPEAYKSVDEVVVAAEKAGLARMVVRLRPMITIKG